MGFSREEYWSRLSFPSPGNLPDPGIEPSAPAASPALQSDSLPGKPIETRAFSKRIQLTSNNSRDGTEEWREQVPWPHSPSISSYRFLPWGKPVISQRMSQWISPAQPASWGCSAGCRKVKIEPGVICRRYPVDCLLQSIKQATGYARVPYIFLYIFEIIHSKIFKRSLQYIVT